MIQSLRDGDQETGHRLSGRLFFILNVLSCREYFLRAIFHLKGGQRIKGICAAAFAF